MNFTSKNVKQFLRDSNSKGPQISAPWEATDVVSFSDKGLGYHQGRVIEALTSESN